MFFVASRYGSDPYLYWAAIIGGSLIDLGAILGAFFALSKRWIWERPAIALSCLGSGLLIFVAAKLTTEFQAIFTLTTIVLTVMFIVSLIDRYIEIFNDDFEISTSEVMRAADEELRKRNGLNY